LTARRSRALIDSIAFLVQMIVRISLSYSRNGTNSAQAFSQSLLIAGYRFSHLTENSVSASSASYDQKPHRRTMMQTWGATVHPSPSRATQAGLSVLAEAPDSPGSLGIAISEAVEAAAGSAETRYALGSVSRTGAGSPGCPLSPRPRRTEPASVRPAW
jgi:hypothetical protein